MRVWVWCSRGTRTVTANPARCRLLPCFDGQTRARHSPHRAGDQSETRCMWTGSWSREPCPVPLRAAIPCPLCDIPSGCCSFTGPWTVTRSSLRMLRRVAAFCRPLRPVLLLVSFPRSRSPVVGVLGLC